MPDPTRFEMAEAGTVTAARDRFGNRFSPGLPYARGSILKSTEDDIRKLRRAWNVIERRIQGHGLAGVFNFTGLERSLRMAEKDLSFADDEIAAALYSERLKTAALQHLGGSRDSHDMMLFNRLTAATFATHLTLVKQGDVVVGITPSYSHPTVSRSARQVGARFIDTNSLRDFSDVFKRETQIALVVITRLAVTYDLLPVDVIHSATRLAHERGVPVYMDDAGGARVGPAVFGQPRTLELGVDIGATGLDKYGTGGPRLGLLAGKKEIVGRIYGRAFEYGLEARPMLYPAALRSLVGYTPDRVCVLVTTTKELGAGLRETIGDIVHETPVAVQLKAEDILELGMERGGVREPTIVPLEATAALAMLLLEDYGILTVHFAGLPPGTPHLLFKFIPPETLARFGGPIAFAEAVNGSLSKLGRLLQNAENIQELLMGEA